MSGRPSAGIPRLRVLALAATLGLAPATAGAVDTELEAEIQATIELQQARARIKAEDHASAMALLEAARQRTPDDPDIHSLLGFTARRLGRLEEAHAHYARALRLDPNHRGALEYLGELHLMEGNSVAARELLARLEQLCPAGCEERAELEAALAAYGAQPAGAD